MHLSVSTLSTVSLCHMYETLKPKSLPGVTRPMLSMTRAHDI